MAKLVVGLGNPGKAYEKSKHNIGFICLDHFAKANKVHFKKEQKFLGEVLNIGNNLLLKPKTYMNLSGNSVKLIADYYRIQVEDILVISDDLDLPFAKIRLREKGGSGGHNGLKSIMGSMGSDEFKRCRIGIDRKEDQDAKEQVLSRFSKKELKELNDLAISVSLMIDDFFAGVSFSNIMNKYNAL